MTYAVLTFANNYVDESRLLKGIYITNKPTLHDKDMTIESMLDLVGRMFTKGHPDVEVLKQNISKCKMKQVSVNILDV